MKTISGRLVSAQPISLSKAAKYISDFASFDNNGASDTISIYLNRAAEAFNSLVQFHKELKHPQSSHKKKHREKHYSVGKESDARLKGQETGSWVDGKEKSRSHLDSNRGEEEEEKRVESVIKKEENYGVEEMGSGKKKRKEKLEKIEDLKVEEDGGGDDDVENVVNGKLERKMKDKKKKSKKNEEPLNVEVCTGGERRKGSEPGGNVEDENVINGKLERKMKDKKKRKIKEELEVKEVKDEGRMVDAGEKGSAKKKRKSKE